MALSNYIPSSRVMQPGVCTSSTRPASPYEGMMIYETDTDLTYLYNGSSWQQISGGTAVGNSGLVLIKQVTVGSAVSSVNITSCLDSTYDSYRVSWSNITASNSQISLLMKLLVGTTPTSSGWYGNTFYIGNGATGGFTNAVYTNSASIECGNLSNTYKNAGFFEMQQPNLATGTFIQWSASDDVYWRMATGTLRNTTQYDGVQILPYAGTLTGGIITVYGYRKA